MHLDVSIERAEASSTSTEPIPKDSSCLNRKRYKDTNEVHNSSILSREQRSHIHEAPESFTFLTIEHTSDLKPSLLFETFGDLHNRPSAGERALHKQAVSPQDLFGGVLGHFQEAMAGIDDGIIPDSRIRENEAEI